MESALFWIVPVSSIIALILAWYFYKQMMRESEGTPTMAKIASHVRQGAMSYLKQQYKIVALIFLCLVILFSIMAYGFNLQNHWVPVAFLTGGFFSGLSGFLGMKTATYASARTANAARTAPRTQGRCTCPRCCPRWSPWPRSTTIVEPWNLPRSWTESFRDCREATAPERPRW